MDARVANIVTSTITNGAVLALLAVGFVVMFRATKVVSFAQGAFGLVGAFVFLGFVHKHVGLYPSLALAVVVNLVLGAATYRIVFARIVGSEPFISAMATIGLATVLEACAIMIFGSAPIVLPQVISARTFHVVGSLTITPTGILTICLTAIVFAVLVVGMHGTRFGLRMQAVADKPRLAAYSGVNVVGMSMLTWAIAAGTAAIACVAFIMTTQPSPSSVYGLGLVAFPAILLGGFDSVIGALVGGFVLSLTQNVVVTYAGGKWQDVASYGLLLVVLLIRPQGIFGSAEASRV